MSVQIPKQEIPFVVIGHKDIRKAVVVVVGYRHTHSFTDVFGNPARGGNVGKSAIAVIVIQKIGQPLIESRRTGEALSG